MEKLKMDERIVSDLIFRWLDYCVSDEESLKQDCFIREGTSMRVDFFLEKGCAELGIVGKTAIEIKRNIIFNTIYRLKAAVDDLNAEKEDVKLILIYVNSNVPIEFMGCSIN